MAFDGNMNKDRHKKLHCDCVLGLALVSKSGLYGEWLVAVRGFSCFFLKDAIGDVFCILWLMSYNVKNITRAV